jgi:hypothetical protein
MGAARTAPFLFLPAHSPGIGASRKFDSANPLGYLHANSYGGDTGRNFPVHPEFNLMEDTNNARQQDAPEESNMFSLVDALFGCTHRHCTFPRTSKKPGTISTTYVVCLDCGRELPYDWQEMRLVASVKPKQRAVA